MRLCRYAHDPEKIEIGLYEDDVIFPLRAVAAVEYQSFPDIDWLLPFLPGGELAEPVQELYEQLGTWPKAKLKHFALATDDVELYAPFDEPGKLLLLAGNYPEHVRERGDLATERAQTFPYVFMKPSSTIQDPNCPVILPTSSPDHIDWEAELAVVIGQTCRGVSEEQALASVAGYTIINDISDRKYRPNPGRITRDRDRFFDWQHGKWHDTFCPMGPCVLSAAACPDPQQLEISLTLNGEVKQSSSTGQMIFPVAAVIAFLSQLMTLEAGDVISTGTPAGTGSATGTYLKHGDQLVASIAGIGSLASPVLSERGANE